MSKRDPSMSGNDLPSVRPGSWIITFDKERGRVGWAHWRAGKKRGAARYRRRILNRLAIQDQLEQ